MLMIIPSQVKGHPLKGVETTGEKKDSLNNQQERPIAKKAKDIVQPVKKLMEKVASLWNRGNNFR
jgi:hypothetical protein